MTTVPGTARKIEHLLFAGAQYVSFAAAGLSIRKTLSVNLS